MKYANALERAIGVGKKNILAVYREYISIDLKPPLKGNLEASADQKKYDKDPGRSIGIENKF